jgi:hypothetical protein
MHRTLLRTRMPSPPTPTAELLDHHQKEQDLRTRLGRGSVFKRQLQQLNRKHNTPAVTTAEPAAAKPTTKRTGTTATSGSSRPKERTMSSNGRLLFRRGSVDSGDDVGTAEAPWQGTAPALARRSISTRTRIRHTASCTHEHVRTGTPDHLQARPTLIHSPQPRSYDRKRTVLMFNEALLVDQIKRPSRSYREVLSTPICTRYFDRRLIDGPPHALSPFVPVSLCPCVPLFLCPWVYSSRCPPLPLPPPPLSLSPSLANH